MKELKFIHITKCAGTFIEDIGKINNINWGRFHPEYGYWHDFFPPKPRELKTKYDWFMVVRNPYDRIISEYYCEWGGIGKKNIRHSKEEFNNFLMSKILTRIKTGEHYSEQYKYFDETIPINIIRFENLNSELNTLFKKFNVNIDIYKYAKTNTKESKNKSLRFKKNDLSKEIISLINLVYDNDFEYFNYDKINSGILKSKNNYDDQPDTINIKISPRIILNMNRNNHNFPELLDKDSIE